MLVDSDDYSATNGTSITLVTGADSDDVLTVFNIPGGKGLDSGQVSGVITADVDASFVSGLGTSAVPNLPASKITSGTLDSDRLPAGTFSSGGGGVTTGKAIAMAIVFGG